ncbi:UNVERIFIED_CONTAM: hypothetical protein HDU68_003370 [Siphonaria sp. JEL0065]|nr:hypothetical protein HDU68_003370 [Siphonaria sp. JEL0065]
MISPIDNFWDPLLFSDLLAFPASTSEYQNLATDLSTLPSPSPESSFNCLGLYTPSINALATASSTSSPPVTMNSTMTITSAVSSPLPSPPIIPSSPIDASAGCGTTTPSICRWNIAGGKICSTCSMHLQSKGISKKWEGRGSVSRLRRIKKEERERLRSSKKRVI